MTKQPEPSPSPATPNQRDAVGAIARRLSSENFGTGSRAELRRLDPLGPLSEPALQRLLARSVPEDWLRSGGIERWALLIHAMALAAPDHLRPDTRLGAALFAAGWKEGRLVNLLDATGDDLVAAVRRAVHFLVAKGHGLNAYELADLILSADRDHGDWATRVRRRIASDYYRAEARAEPAA